MRIDPEKCIGCGKCAIYCPVDCIRLVPRPEGVPGQGKKIGLVDEEECVECSCCRRAQVCETEALVQPKLVYPRTIRAAFSDPTITFAETGVAGRGTEEMKTNDVTGRFTPGKVGFATEMGRPSLGARLRDLEKMAVALAKLGARFEPKNPVTCVLMADPATGALKPEVRDEKVLSAIIEAEIPIEKFGQVLRTVKSVAGELESVFSLDVICLPGADGQNPVDPILAAEGFTPRLNGKTSLGLGRKLNKGVK